MALKTDRPIKIYQLKVALLGTRPPIWWRLLVPGNMSLAELHAIVQASFDWQDCHLHQFRIGSQRYGPREMGEMDDDDHWLDEKKAWLGDVLRKVGDKALYTYDFGDSWEHSITVEKVLAPESAVKYPVCTGGKNQAPPEDCGGIGGFYNLLEAISDPDHEEHEDQLEWLGEGFDPKLFSMDEVNLRLREIFR
jgi:hypothetical protein